MSNYTPYSNWTRQEMFIHLKRAAVNKVMPLEVIEMLKKACFDDRWNPIQDYNGCSIVQDPTHPTVACFIHDYLYKTGQGGKDADKIWKWLFKIESGSKFKSKIFYRFIRIGWLAYYKWVHLANRNVNKYDKEFKKLIKIIK